MRRLFPPALKRGRKPADMKLLVSQQEDELRSSSKLRKVLSTKTGRKEKKDKSSRTPSPYNIFMREEVTTCHCDPPP